MRAPPRLQRRVVRHRIAFHARGEAQFRPIPMRRAIRRKNREGKIRETPGNQLCVRLQHVMRRFVPSEVTGPVTLVHRKVAHQSAHPVRLGADCERHGMRARHIRIGRLPQHALPGIRTPDKPIEQVETRWIACLDRQRRKRDQGPRDAETAAAFRKRIRAIVVPADRPLHIIRLRTGEDQRAGGGAPAFPVGFALQHDTPHRPSKLHPVMLSNPGWGGMLRP